LLLLELTLEPAGTFLTFLLQTNQTLAIVRSRIKVLVNGSVQAYDVGGREDGVKFKGMFYLCFFLVLCKNLMEEKQE
jgi:hypothetical protein